MKVYFFYYGILWNEPSGVQFERPMSGSGLWWVNDVTL